ncbi:MAG: PAS domain S-box protein [Bacteroidales bacterium]|nr:PAS domain S-box protein [Bacteroidales bacterium]MCF8328377.1 PAS domain S-box protein [Bacteroidales bacterium]
MYLKKELYGLIRTDESIFDFIQESALDGLWYWDLENPENEWMNAKFWTVLGYNPDEMPHKSSAWQDIINQDDMKLAMENFTKHCENPNHPYDQVVRYTHKNSSTVWIRCRGMAIRDKNGKAIRMLGAHQDVSDIKRNEHELIRAKEKAEASEEKYSELIENMTNAVAIFQAVDDGEGFVFKDFNKAGEKIENIKREELIGRKVTEMFPAVKEFGLFKVFQEVWKTGEPQYYPVVMYKDNRITSWEDNYVYKLSSGEIVSVYEDITRRKQAEEQLQKAKDALQTISDNMLDLVAITDLKGNFKFASSSHKILGFEIEYIIGKNVMDFLHPDDLPEVQAKFAGFITNPKSSGNATYRGRCADGSYLWFETFGTLISDNDGNPKEILFNTRDITERKRAEESILELKEFNESIVTNLAEGVILENDDGIIQFANPAMLKMLGYKESELVGEHWNCFVPEDQIEVVKNANKRREKGESDQYELELVRKDGERIFVLVGGVPNVNKGVYTGLLAAFTDITRRKRAEKELHKSNQRLESLLEISQKVTSTIDKDTIMQMIVDNATRLIGLDTGAIYMKNDAETISLSAITPVLPNNFPDDLRIANLKHHPHLNKALRSGKHVLMEDALSAKLTSEEKKIADLRKLRTIIY